MVNGANKKIIFISILLITLTFINFKRQSNMNIKKIDYIITEAKQPDSYDPIKADATNNLTIMRMSYSTILQVNDKNELYSNVLSEFNYDFESKTITFKINKEFQYEDGTSISIQDILIPILRVAYTHKNFPVLKDIIGYEEWINKPNQLLNYPKGIQINEDTITIKLEKDYSNPLFRFCLEIFSVIPSSCIDLKTNQITCERPTESGYYKLSERENNKFKFTRRSKLSAINDKVNYDFINIVFQNDIDLCDHQINKNTILAGNETQITQQEIQKCQNQITWLPASRFGMILINPNLPPFNKKQNRRFFAEKIREYLQKNYQDLNVESSIFTKIIPGYIPKQESNSEKIDLKDFQNVNFYIPTFSKTAHKQTISAINVIAKELKMNIINLNTSPGIDSIQSFTNNKASVMIGSSGFWPQDPVGDMKMFFSKNFHQPLKFLWEDKKLEELYTQINDTDTNLDIKMRELNLHINDQSLLCPILHFKRFFITKSKIQENNLPVTSVTSPAPWQINLNENEIN